MADGPSTSSGPSSQGVVAATGPPSGKGKKPAPILKMSGPSGVGKQRPQLVSFALLFFNFSKSLFLSVLKLFNFLKSDG